MPIIQSDRSPDLQSGMGADRDGVPMTVTQSGREADLLVRFAHVTEGPVMAVEDPCDGRDYKVAVEKLDRAGCVGVVICRA